MTDPIEPRTDDELLSALLDGALPEPEVQRLRVRLAVEPALAARLAALERADVAVRDAYAGVVDEPLPPAVLALLAEPAELARDGVAAHANVVPFERRPSGAWRAGLPAALAASLTLAVGLSLGWVAGSQRAGFGDWLAAAGTVAAGSSLHDVLEGVPSGVTRELGDSVAATPRLTFRTAGGDYCRELELASAQGATGAVACRRSGAWRVEVAAFAPPAAAGVYRPATGAGSAVAAAVDTLLDGAPLEPAEERAAIARGWEQ